MAIDVSLLEPVITNFTLRFDDDAIQRRLRKRRRTILMQSGALVAKIARRSIKPTKWSKVRRRQFRGTITKSGRVRYVHDYVDLQTTISQPGQPPRRHPDGGNKLELNDIIFAYDTRTKAVRVGPRGTGRTPSVLEHGGIGIMKVPRWAQRRSRVGGRSVIRKKIRARPFMGPALLTFKDKYPEMWRDVIR